MSGPDPVEPARRPEAQFERRWGKRRRPKADMGPEEATRLLDRLERAGIAVWVAGGWGVDALLCEQRRSHDDLDLIVGMDDVPRLQEVSKSQGYTFQHGEPPLGFELVNPGGCQVDVHPVIFDERGDGIFQIEDGMTRTYRAEDLAGTGHIAGRPVRCLTPEFQMRLHLEPEFSDDYGETVEILQERFVLEPPHDYRPARA